MAPTYTVLAYRPEGEDSCRGNVYDRSSSCFEIQWFDSLEQAAEFWAAKKWEDRLRARAYCEWELTLLVDGQDPYTWSERTSHEAEEPADVLERLSKERLKELEEAAALKARKAKAAAELAAAMTQQEVARHKQAQDYMEFRRLQAKFAGSFSSASSDEANTGFTAPSEY